jgi:trigger factor
MVAAKNIERLERSSVKLTITVPRDEVAKEYKALLADYSKNVQIDGFRKGKVPASVLERKFGEALRVDAMGRVMEKSVEEVVKDIEEKPLAYSTPTVGEEPTFSLDEDFTFSVTYDVFPTVPVADWKGLEIEIPQVSVGAEDEEKELLQIRERNAIVVEKPEGAPAEKGDVATVEYRELAADGSTVPGSERQDFTFEIGTGYNLYKFDDEVIGLKKGDSKKIAKTFPADYEYKELAGRSVTVEVKVGTLKAKNLPALDDDLAQDVSEKYKTLADLKADLRKQLDKRLEDKLRQLREKAVVDGILERTKVELPVSMLNAELAMRWENLKSQMGLDSDDKLDRILSYSGKTRTDLLDDWRPNAERAIVTRLILEKLTEEGKYECSEADLDAEWKRMSEESGLSIDEIKAEYEKRGSMDYLRDRIKEDKLLADILAATKIKKGKKMAFVDLFAEKE